MHINHLEIRLLFKKFWQEKNHKEIPPIPLIPQNDPTTLFTGSGMQQLVPYLLGEIHPLGKRLYNIQPCFRSQDIEEIGDNRHTTFFEMMGNWSLGDYFKKEQLSWFWEFLTKNLNLPKNKLYVSVFKGDLKNNLSKDNQSYEIWLNLGVSKKNIFEYGSEHNWWSRGGDPDSMPIGEPGGPDSEVFYDFGAELKLHENSQFKNKPCHPNCGCGRFLEIGNSVFMEFQKTKNGFKDLPNKNVDFGGGLERTIAVLNNNPDIYQTDLYQGVIILLEEITGKKYESVENKKKMRIITDHLKGSVFLIKDGVFPSNKEKGYVLRRLLRRIVVKMQQLKNKTISEADLKPLVEKIIEIYQDVYFKDIKIDYICSIIEEEINRFNKTLNIGLKILEKIEKPTGKKVFDLYQNYGFPKELTEELLKEKKLKFDEKEFNEEFEKHRQLSRQRSLGMFKGGLADYSNQTIKYHTATHLLHQALCDVLGKEIRQEGSNINNKRLRFDFYSIKTPQEKDIKKAEKIVNQKIKELLPVNFVILPLEKAYKVKAKSLFREKYPNLVKVYYIGKNLENAYSKEFCGGPHVKNTKEVGKITVFKIEKIGANLYRIYAK